MTEKQPRDHAPEPPLNEKEIHRLREMLKKEEHVAWFWSTARIWATWIVAVLGALALIWTSLKGVVKQAVQ